MPIEEEERESISQNFVKLTQNFIGAGGIEAMTVDDGTTTTTSYPLYDTHGNMIATVTKNGAGTAWNIGDERNYDVWGGVRQGAATSGPKGRYVANLGHVQDDESGLIYMRARYYEPETGRFISEDLYKTGRNFFVYASNLPTTKCDPSGNSDEETQQLGTALMDYAKILMSIGIAAFLSGMINHIRGQIEYLTGLAILSWPNGGAYSLVAADHLRKGMLLMLLGTGAMMQGVNAVVRGLYLAKAGSILAALGDDGWEFAASFIEAGKPGGLPSGLIGKLEEWFDTQPQ
ncbi:MAG: RHS repeat-associated core domain-containing protein [Fimbriimonadaceae bacterium]|nr:MAG: RHS repeat-associated core domain-containing protein [Fimbriimonadaceae bacterium]